jgi:hypothetical protein
MIALWILLGSLLITAAFFLPGHSSELWPNINSAGIVLLLYLAALLGAFSSKTDVSKRRRIIVLVVAVISIAGGAFAWVQMEDQSQWQRRQLGKIATVIGRGIFTTMISDSLLPVLEDYHAQKGKAKKALGEMYRLRYPHATIGPAWSSMEPTGRPNPPYDVFLTELSDTHVVLVARHPWYKGNDAWFTNHAGLVGTLQVRATLTEKGLQYVTEN